MTAPPFCMGGSFLLRNKRRPTFIEGGPFSHLFHISISFHDQCLFSTRSVSFASANLRFRSLSSSWV